MSYAFYDLLILGGKKQWILVIKGSVSAGSSVRNYITYAAFLPGYTVIVYPAICYLYCLSVRVVGKLKPILAEFG